jgi:hypothetical protein
MTDPYRDFLCAAFRSDCAEVRTALQRDTWNWETLIRTASNEALLPGLHNQFKSLDLLNELPLDIADFLLAVETANRERNEAITAELKAAVAHLNRIGIEPVLLKGLAYLTTGVYEDPAHRFLMDIDILVPEEQREVAAEALIQNGWVADHLDPFRNFRHHAPPLRRPSSVWIDIHHSLGIGACERVLPARGVIERSVAVNLDGLRVRVPAKEDLLTHLIMHSQIQHPYHQRIWPPVRAMADLLHLSRRFGPDLNWGSVANRFSAAGKYGVFALHLLQVQDSLSLAPQLCVTLNPFLQFCRYRRRALQNHPTLRYLDPFYMFPMALAHRLRRLRKMLKTRKGAQCLLSQILAPENYLHLWTDLVQGRGR